MEPELGSVDFVGKSGTNKNVPNKQMRTKVSLCTSR